MNPTDEFYYVVADVILPPEDVYVGSDPVEENPFSRPTRVGDAFVGENSDDAFLTGIGVYRLWTDAPPDPGYGYQLVEGTPTVANERVERVDSWEAVDPALLRAQYQAQIESQEISYTQREIKSDPILRGNLDINTRQIEQALSDLVVTPDAELGDFDPDLASHPIANSAYAASLVTQELETLAKDGDLTSTGVEGILTPTERSEMMARIADNADIARGVAGSVTVPGSGVQRAMVSLEGEQVEQALFQEVTFDWAAQDYFVPKVVLPRIPPEFVPTQTYAMIYDQDNVYRSWMPFEQQPDGSWATPSNVDYIAIAKADSAVWRVAVAYGGTTEDYEITQRVVLVPPDVIQSPVRWGGRT